MNWLQSKLSLVLALLLALAVVAVGVQSLRLAAMHADVAQREQAHAEAALLYAEAARQTEQAWAKKLQEVQHARDAELARAHRIGDGLRTDREWLRVDTASFAAGPADDSAAACRERAATLGRLLDDALRTAATIAGSAEQHAADVRALRASWPVNEPHNEKPPSTLQ